MSFFRDLKDFIEFRKAGTTSMTIEQLYTVYGEKYRDLIWLRGEPYELQQYYRQGQEYWSASFWASAPSHKIHKIHSGIPRLMCHMLSEIVTRDLDEITAQTEGSTTDWQKIEKNTSFKAVVKAAVRDACAFGDGAFRIVTVPDEETPLIEFVPGYRCDFIRGPGGKVQAVVFKSEVREKGEVYILHQIYGKGFIKYQLFDRMEENEIPLSQTEETANLREAHWNSGLMLAVPLIVRPSDKFPGRGDSIFEGKYSVFDALDEVISQWADAVRKGRVKRYIPSSLFIRDPENGKMRPFNDFDDNYIATETSMKEGSQDQIITSQAEIRSEQYLQAYMTYLDLAIQGVISPSTLGIDTKKLDNAEAQREKEKSTLYTRNQIIMSLTEALQTLVNTALQTYDIISGRAQRPDEEITVSFGEYANPSFESVVETMAKAKTAGIMSNEMIVSQLYGDSLTDKEKQEEIDRLNGADAALNEDPFVSSFDGERF